MPKKSRILEILSEYLQQDSAEIDLKRKFKDDLEKEDILMMVEDELGVEWTSEEADAIGSIGELIAALDQRKKGGSKGADVAHPSTINLPNFDTALQEAQSALEQEYYKTKPETITRLALFQDQKCQAKVETFIGTAFANLRKAALARKSTHQSGLINTVAHAALIQLIAILKKKSLIPALIEEFQYVTDHHGKKKDGISRHYELMMNAGDIALALSAMSYDGSLEFMNPFLEWCEGRYDTNDFLMKVYYLRWVNERGASSALNHIAKYDAGVSFAVAALADMNHQEAIGAISEKAKKLKQPIFTQVCLEAIRRLKTQKKAPATSDRMIHLFGKRTSTELALGAESDNVFVQRARESTGDEEIGMVTETDDSHFT